VRVDDIVHGDIKTISMSKDCSCSKKDVLLAKVPSLYKLTY